MNYDQAIAAIAVSREGFIPIACTPVALPFWRLRVRVEILARRPISPLEEFALRAALEADSRLRQIQALLGLDDDTFEDVIASIVGREWASVSADARLVITDAGREAALSAVRERSEERVVQIDFDGLLRQPTFLDFPLEPQQRRALGLRELPANPVTPPDQIELSGLTARLQDLIRRAGDGRDQEIELLAVKGVLRKDRIYREATLVIFRSESEGVQAAPVIDGSVSEAHEYALARPVVMRQLRIPSELRRGRRFEQLLPSKIRALYDPALDDHARQLRRKEPDGSAAGETTGADSGRAAATEAIRRLKVRMLGPQEHPELLRVAIRTTKSRLIIATSTIAALTIDADFVADLRKLIADGVAVTIAHATPRDQSLGALSRLFERHTAIEMRLRESRPVSTVIRDENLAVYTLFPVLAFRGRERPFRDERGWLVTDPVSVRELSELALEGAEPATRVN